MPHQDQPSRLVPLSETDRYVVREGDPDVRGWSVQAADGRVIGRVDDLIVDVEARRARYLRVRLDEAAGRDPYVLLPIGIATLDEERDVVNVPTVTVGAIGSLERHAGGLVEREYEVVIRRGILGAAPDAAGDLETAGDDFYEHEAYDEERFYDPRRQRSDEREFLEHLAVTSVSEEDEAPEVVGEVRAGDVQVPILEDEDRRTEPDVWEPGGQREEDRQPPAP